MKFTEVYKKVPEGYIGFVKELPGANTQSKTRKIRYQSTHIRSIRHNSGPRRQPDTLHRGVSEGEGCGRIRGSVLGSVAGAATDRAVSGHACDAGA